MFTFEISTLNTREIICSSAISDAVKPVDFYRGFCLSLLQEEPREIPSPQGPSALGAPYTIVLGQTLCVQLRCAETHKWRNGNPKPKSSLINWINKLFSNVWTLKLVFNLGKNIFLIMETSNLFSPCHPRRGLTSDLCFPLYLIPLFVLLHSLPNQTICVTAQMLLYSSESHTFLGSILFGQLSWSNEAFTLPLSARPFLP